MSINNYISFTKTTLPFGWMGNMSPYPIQYKGKEWRTTEALFQALRFNDVKIQDIIRAEKRPLDAKYKALSFSDKMFITPLSEEDINNMRLCIKLKIEQYPNLLTLLLKTENLPIYENVTKRGNIGNNLFWGAMLVDNKWIGKNMLGNIWMEFREIYKYENKGN